MALFQSVDDWARELLDDGIIPSYTNSYAGIGALKNSDVLTAISHIASNVARFPILLKTKDGYVYDDSLEYLINKSPDTSMNGYTWKFVMTVNALLANDGISRIVRDPITDEPSLIEFYPTSQVYIDDTDVRDVYYEFTSTNPTFKTVREPARNVIHFKFFTYDGIHGRSPLHSLKEEIALQESGIHTLTKFFKSGLKGGVLKANGKLNADSRRKIRTEFEKAQQGALSGSPIVIDSTAEYTPLEVDTNILQLINSNNYSTAQIAKALHIPAYKLAVNSPNQSIKQLNEDFIRSDLPYYFAPIVSELENKLLSSEKRTNYSFEFDTRSETGLSISEAVNAINGGLLTIDESRESIGKRQIGDNNTSRLQSDLNAVFLDKKEEYQSMKGGDDRDKRFRSSSDGDGIEQ